MHSTTSHSFSVRFTLIFTKTHKCVHMFIKILYMTLGGPGSVVGIAIG